MWTEDFFQAPLKMDDETTQKLMDKLRNPTPAFEALKRWVEERKQASLATSAQQGRTEASLGGEERIGTRNRTQEAGGNGKGEGTTKNGRNPERGLETRK